MTIAIVKLCESPAGPGVYPIYLIGHGQGVAKKLMNASRTRTGSFPIGFRRGGWSWQPDISAAIDWARNNGFGAIDLGRDVSEIQPVVNAGLRVGSVDLLEWKGLISADAAKRADAVAMNSEYVGKCGSQNYFAVMMPENPSLPRSENFGFMVDSLNALSPALEAAKG